VCRSNVPIERFRGVQRGRARQHVWLGSYRVRPGPLPYRGKLPVHRGASLCSLPAAVHRGGGPTPWRSLTFTGLCKTSLWLLSSPGRLSRLRLLSVARLCLLLLYPPSPSNYFSKCAKKKAGSVGLLSSSGLQRVTSEFLGFSKD
jgi:hypothetical protein